MREPEPIDPLDHRDELRWGVCPLEDDAGADRVHAQRTSYSCTVRRERSKAALDRFHGDPLLRGVFARAGRDAEGDGRDPARVRSVRVGARRRRRRFDLHRRERLDGRADERVARVEAPGGPIAEHRLLDPQRFLDRREERLEGAGERIQRDGIVGPQIDLEPRLARPHVDPLSAADPADVHRGPLRTRDRLDRGRPARPLDGSRSATRRPPTRALPAHGR